MSSTDVHGLDLGGRPPDDATAGPHPSRVRSPGTLDGEGDAIDESVSPEEPAGRWLWRHPTSVRADIHAIVAALQAGADDYVTRSFTVRESTTRPSALGRRVGSAGGPEDEEAQEMEFDHDRPAPLVARERRGTVHVSGPLTVRGADLLQGTVESLHRSGHDRVLLDLQGVQVGDDAGRHVLRDLGRELRASGGELLLHGWWALVQSLALRNQWALWGNRVP